MGKIFKAVKKGFEAAKDSMGPGSYLAGGKEIRCPHCDHNVFREGAAMLNTRGRTFIEVEWADKSATTLVCAHCGYILWFAIQPERKEL